MSLRILTYCLRCTPSQNKIKVIMMFCLALRLKKMPAKINLTNIPGLKDWNVRVSCRAVQEPEFVSCGKFHISPKMFQKESMICKIFHEKDIFTELCFRRTERNAYKMSGRKQMRELVAWGARKPNNLTAPGVSQPRELASQPACLVSIKSYLKWHIAVECFNSVKSAFSSEKLVCQKFFHRLLTT